MWNWFAFPNPSFRIPHFSFRILSLTANSELITQNSEPFSQYLTVSHPITRLPIVSPNGCSLCVSFKALRAERATSASRI
jgi:hypothetical protein